MFKRTALRGIMAIGLSLAATSWAGCTKGAVKDQPTTDMQSVLDAIRSEVGIPVATELTQCKALPIGASPCGGPSDYVVYSTQVSQPAKLQHLANQYTALQKQNNQSSNLVGACVYREPPVLALVDGKCTTHPAGQISIGQPIPHMGK